MLARFHIPAEPLVGLNMELKLRFLPARQLACLIERERDEPSSPGSSKRLTCTGCNNNNKCSNNTQQSGCQSLVRLYYCHFSHSRKVCCCCCCCLTSCLLARKATSDLFQLTEVRTDLSYYCHDNYIYNYTLFRVKRLCEQPNRRAVAGLHLTAALIGTPTIQAELLQASLLEIQQTGERANILT